MPSHWGGYKPFWDAEELKPCCGHAPRELPARCWLGKLCQGSVRCVRQYSSMETRFPMETQFTFDEISCYSIKVFPEAYGTWASLSHLPQPRGVSLCSHVALGWQRVPELGAQPPGTMPGLGQLCGDGSSSPRGL